MVDTMTKPPKQATDLTERDLSWFAAKVAQGAKKRFSEEITITPAMAKRMLEQNADNRPISLRQVKQIARDIRNKHFEVNGETVVVSDDGWLNDGQNRLMAIIEADMPIQSFVVFGVPRKSRMTVDMGRARTTTHYLGMEHVPNAHYAAIVAAQWAAFELGYFGKLTKQRDTGITRQDTLQFYHDHSHMIDNAIVKLRHQLKYIGTQGSTGVLTAYCILQVKDPLHTDDFFRSLLEGSGLDRDDVVLELRNRLIASKKELDPYQKCELVLRHWMAWKDGKKLTKKIGMRNEWPKNLDDYGREPPKHEEE